MEHESPETCNIRNQKTGEMYKIYNVHQIDGLIGLEKGE